MSDVFEQVMAQCARGSFTGLLRVLTREGNGEVRFVSGMQDGMRFDALTGDEALARLQTASDPEFEVIAALPPIDANSTSPVPTEGGLERLHAATLMRYCESNSLTCALELETGGQMLTARYRLGELLSVEPDSDLTSRIAEAKQGLYRFKLPRFELPASARAVSKGGAPASAGTAAVTPVAARPAAPNVAAAFKPAAAPAVQPVRIAPAPHTRPTPAATPAAVRAVPSAPTPARAPAPAVSAAASASAARAAPSPAAAAQRPAAASPARPAVSAEPLRPAPIAAVKAAPAEPARPAAFAAPAARAPEPAPAPASPGPAAVRAAATSPAAETAPAPKAAAALGARPATARSQAITGEGRASQARSAAVRQVVPPVQERPQQRYGLVVVMALVALALVVWVVLGAPLPIR
jgi:hypothetical protein